MANRRSLGEGLSLTPEKMAFIQGSALPVEAAKPALGGPTEIEAAPNDVEFNEKKEEAAEASTADRVETSTRSASQRGRHRNRLTKETRQDPIMFGMANLLVPLTTRLQPATAAALKRAGLEQRLNGAQPATVQEIAEIAITDWLSQNGYL